MNIKIAGITKESIVDGPGIRYVIFSQGCNHECIGCHNPETHDICGGYNIEFDFLINDILKSKYIDGVTFSGGEPFLQSKVFSSIAKTLKTYDIHIICYTGFTIEKLIEKNDESDIELLKNIDVLIDGPFIENLKDLSLSYRGSKNQRIINVKDVSL